MLHLQKKYLSWETLIAFFLIYKFINILFNYFISKIRSGNKNTDRKFWDILAGNVAWDIIWKVMTLRPETIEM